MKNMDFIILGTQKFDFFPFICGYMEKRKFKNFKNMNRK